MNEIEALKWRLERYRAVLSQQIDGLYNALEELRRTVRRRDVLSFVRNQDALTVWSKEFFLDITRRIRCI